MRNLLIGPGRLLTVFNATAQPGKTLTIRDGETIILTVPLDEPFFHCAYDEDAGVQIKVPGINVNAMFMTSLIIETDGDSLDFFYE